MEVLVATTETQGSIDGDDCWTVDGELVSVQGKRIAADLPDGTVVRRSGDFVWTLPPHTFSSPEV